MYTNSMSACGFTTINFTVCFLTKYIDFDFQFTLQQIALGSRMPPS